MLSCHCHGERVGGLVAHHTLDAGESKSQRLGLQLTLVNRHTSYIPNKSHSDPKGWLGFCFLTVTHARRSFGGVHTRSYSASIPRHEAEVSFGCRS